jgi:hypothetical protein
MRAKARSKGPKTAPCRRPGNDNERGPDGDGDDGGSNAHRARGQARKKTHGPIIRGRDNRRMTLPIRLAGLLALLATTLGAAGALAQGLPPAVDAALARAKLPRDAVTMLVVEVDGKSAPRLSHLAQLPVNPASVMKLVTTFAALDQLGPAFTWRTPVYLEGTLRDGNLMGNVYIKGQGDPKLVAERLWLLLRRVQGLGHTANHRRHSAGPQRVCRASARPRRF